MRRRGKLLSIWLFVAVCLVVYFVAAFFLATAELHRIILIREGFSAFLNVFVPLALVWLGFTAALLIGMIQISRWKKNGMYWAGFAGAGVFLINLLSGDEIQTLYSLLVLIFTTVALFICMRKQWMQFR